MNLPTTPSQTVGPFFDVALAWRDGEFVVPEGSAGAFWLRGRVVDGVGAPVADAIVETWQADPEGRYDAARWDGFRGFGRSLTDDQGRWGVHTVKPGRVAGSDGAMQAPHVAVTVVGRGLLNRVVTRVYFADETVSNRDDAVLRALPDDTARSTLLAAAADGGYRFDIHLQGEHETVFFTF